MIAKLPYAYLGDKRVKRRSELDENWYKLHTAQKLIQACGRSIRSDTDYATTYILDQAFTGKEKDGRDGFYARAYDFFPEYFREAVRIGEVHL